VSEASLDTLWLRILPQPLRSKLAGRHLLQTLIENAGWLVADKVVRLGTGLFVGVWVARYLEPSRFGTLNYITALIGLIAALSTLGLPDINVRDFVRHGERAREIAATSIVLRCIGALLSILVAMIVVVVSQPGDGKVLAMAVIVGASLLPQALDVVDQFYQARNQVRPIVIRRNAAYAVTSILKLVAVFTHAPLIAFALIYTVEFLLVAVALILYSRRDRLIDLSKVSLIEAQRLLSASWPLLVRQFAIGIYMRLDQVLVGSLLDNHSVGIYAAATRISEIWYFIPVAIMTAFVPRLTAQHVRSPADYSGELVRVMRVIIIISALAAVSMSIFAVPIISMLYGPAYAGAAPVLAIHAWSGLFVGLGVASSSWFVNNGLTRYGLYQAVAGALISVILNVTLVPWFGVVGAAWAAIGSYFVSAVLVNLFARPTREILRLQLRAIGISWARI
jgi:PST family polysaccharide transporter